MRNIFCLFGLGYVITATALASDLTNYDRLNVGTGHKLTGSWATIAGGANNTNIGYYGVISGGAQNFINAVNGTDNGSLYCAIGGGVLNVIQSNAYRSVIAGGAGNTIDVGADRSSIGGGDSNYIGDNSAYGWIGGGVNNSIGQYSAYASIGAGGGCTIRTNAAYATVCGGWSNIVGVGVSSGLGLNPSVIAGGYGNLMEDTGYASTIAGGFYNLIQSNANYATIGGGQSNRIVINSGCSFIGGGFSNAVSGSCAVAGGGYENSASGDYCTVPGGVYNLAGGYASFAAGLRAKAKHNGTFVWADNTSADVASTGNNQFIARASGGFWFGANSSPSLTSGHLIDTSTGAFLSNGGVWSPPSDRNSKENFQEVDSRKILQRLSEVKVQTWNYRAEGKGIRHIGPVAQDFAAAFEVGEDDKHISTVDSEGVALVAIQALHDMLKEKDARIAELHDELISLRAQVAEVQRASEQWETRFGLPKAR